MAGTITAVNTVFAISIPGVFSTPQVLQGYSADDVFDTEAVELAETQFGVDGVFTAGFKFVETPQNVTFLGSSPSISIFEAWKAAQDGVQDVIYASATVLQPSIGRKYSLQQGVLMRYSQFADVKKVIQPRKFGLVWGFISAAPS